MTNIMAMPLDVIKTHICTNLTLQETMRWTTSDKSLKSSLYSDDDFWARFFKARPLEIRSALNRARRHHQYRFMGIILRMSVTDFVDKPSAMQELCEPFLHELNADLQTLLFELPREDFRNKPWAMRNMLQRIESIWSADLQERLLSLPPEEALAHEHIVAYIVAHKLSSLRTDALRQRIIDRYSK